MFYLHGGAGAVGILGVVEEGEELVIFPVRDGIELVGVALGAAHGEAEPHGAGGVDAIDDGLDAELFAVRSTLLVDEGVAVEGGGDELGFGGVGKEVAGELLDGEAVEREVVVEGLDDPIAVGPHVAATIDRVAVGVGIAGLVEPVPPPALAVVRAGEEAIDEARPGVGALVVDEGRRFLQESGGDR